MTTYRIVVALDLSEYSEVVLEHALDQAARHAAPDLNFLHVVANEADVDAMKQRLSELVLPALDGLDATDWRARMHVRVGVAHEEIANLADELRAQLIVMGRFGTHPQRHLGAVASRVLAATTCPTLVVGLFDESLDATAQCSECVAIRAESDGERLFCATHAAPDRMSVSPLLAHGVTWTGGGGGSMW
jgi:nucleotide-binding universal stress UspA family protein